MLYFNVCIGSAQVGRWAPWFGLAQLWQMVRKEHIYLLVSGMLPNCAWEPFWKRSRINTDIILFLREELIYHKFEIAPLTRTSRIWEASQVALVVKNQPANAGDMRDAGLISGLGRSPGEEHGNPLQYSCLENPKDRRAWWAMVRRVAESRTQLKRLSTHTEGF